MALHAAALDCIKFQYPETFRKVQQSACTKSGEALLTQIDKLKRRDAGVTAKDYPVAKTAAAKLQRSTSGPPSVLSVPSSTSTPAGCVQRSAASTTNLIRVNPDGWSVPRTPTRSEVSRVHFPGQFGQSSRRLKPKGQEHDVYSLVELSYTHGDWQEKEHRETTDPLLIQYKPKKQNLKGKRGVEHDVHSTYGLDFTHGTYKPGPPYVTGAQPPMVFKEKLRISELPNVEELQKEWEELFTRPPRQNPRSISRNGYKRNPQGNQYQFSAGGSQS